MFATNSRQQRFSLLPVRQETKPAAQCLAHIDPILPLLLGSEGEGEFKVSFCCAVFHLLLIVFCLPDSCKLFVGKINSISSVQ